MRYSARLSDAVHVLVFIALNGDPRLTSDKIAESIKTNPACVRKLMSQLKKGGLIVNTRGHPAPALAREASEISLLDVYDVVEGDKPLLHLDTHINPECGVGVNIQLSLGECFDRIHEKARAEMEAITIAEVISIYQRRIAHLRQ